MQTRSVSVRVDPALKERLDSIAQVERRTTSDVIKLAIEHYLATYEELHPQFLADIHTGLKEMHAGRSTPYAFD
jgi:predicted transcriptional regulator